MSFQKASIRTLFKFYRAAIQLEQFHMAQKIENEIMQRLEVAGS
jgi:ribosomal protein S20